jgi:hypothetical protein
MTSKTHDDALNKLSAAEKSAVTKQIKTEIEKEVAERLAKETIDGLMTQLYDLEERMEELKDAMAEEDHTLIAIPHPTKKHLGKEKLVVEYEKWTDEGKAAKAEYEQLEKDHIKLLDTDIIATLRSTPWEHDDRLSGSVNGEGWTLVLGNKSSDGGTMRHPIKFKHLVSTLPDAQGSEQCGVYTYRKERNQVTQKWSMVPIVKPVIMDSRPAKKGEVAKSKAQGKRDYKRLKEEIRNRRSREI